MIWRDNTTGFLPVVLTNHQKEQLTVYQTLSRLTHSTIYAPLLFLLPVITKSISSISNSIDSKTVDASGFWWRRRKCDNCNIDQNPTETGGKKYQMDIFIKTITSIRRGGLKCGYRSTKAKTVSFNHDDGLKNIKAPRSLRCYCIELLMWGVQK